MAPEESVTLGIRVAAEDNLSPVCLWKTRAADCLCTRSSRVHRHCVESPGAKVLSAFALTARMKR